MRRKSLALLLAIVAATAGAAWWYGGSLPFGREQVRDDHLTLYGNVDIRQVQLGFRVAGRLAETMPEEGDAVAAGTVLARLEAGPYQDAERAARAQVDSLRATLQRLEAGPRPEEIAQARAAHVERQAELRNAEQTWRRTQELRPSGAISQAAVDDARAAKEVASARVGSTREALRLLEAGTRSEDIAAARAELEGAEANLAAARRSLRDAELKAPADGVVLSRVREAGAIVSPSDVVYVVSLPDPVWVRAYVAEPDLGRIRPGMAVDVFTDSAPDKPYRGSVGFISPVAEFTPKSVETPELRTSLVYRLRVRIEDGDTGLLQGMPVTVMAGSP